MPHKRSTMTRRQLLADAAKAGAATVHIHSRDPQDGRPTSDLEIFGRIIDMIKAESDVVVCTTTGGGFGMTAEQRVAVVPRYKPELASFNMGSLNFAIFPLARKPIDWKFEWEKPYLEASKNNIFENRFGTMEQMCRIFRESGTKPELEVYDVGHLYNVQYLLSEGLLDTPVYLQFVLGILGGIGASIVDLVNLKETADRLIGPKNFIWSAFGAGRQEFPICTAAANLGGNCRVGLEDNLWLSKGELAPSNAALVEKMVRILREFSLEPATPDEARSILHLRKS